MFRNIGFLVLLCLSFFFFSSIVSAAEPHELTPEELNYLYNELGFTEEQIALSPVSDLKDLVAGEAETVMSFDEEYDMENTSSKNTSSKNFSTLAAIPSADLSFSGRILKIATSDVSGYDKYYSSATFRWLNHPAFNLTDKMTIGFPSSLGVFFKTSSGNIVGHYSTTTLYNKSTGGSTVLASSTTPSTWQPALGVASAHNLRTTLNSNQNNAGQVSQYFYVKSSLAGNANVQFQYGHKRISGTVGITFGTSPGIGITPSTTTDIRSYAGQFSY
ncbi:hypothetical protein [Planococcus dechangensis]